MTNQEILAAIRARLPHSTQALVAMFGWRGALRFLRQHCNQRELYVPQKYTADHPTFSTLSRQQAKRLIKAFGGQDLRVPSYKKMLASERNYLLAKDYRAGYDATMLAEKYRCERQFVSVIVKDLGVKPKL